MNIYEKIKNSESILIPIRVQTLTKTAQEIITQ